MSTPIVAEFIGGHQPDTGKWIPYAWRIGCRDGSPDWFWIEVRDGVEVDSLKFANQSDAERAVKCLNDAGIITGDDLLAIDDVTARQICTRDLAW